MKNYKYFQHLKDGDCPVNDGENRVYYFEMHRYYSNNPFRNFSIKFPLDGNVTYHTAEKKLTVLPMDFLVCARQPGEVFVESDSIVRAFCIDINCETFAEIFTLLSGDKKIDIDELHPGYLNCPDFFENIYRPDQCAAGNKLLMLSTHLLNETDDTCLIDEEWFLDLAEKIILQEHENFKMLNSLRSVRSATRKETLRRLNLARSYMNDVFIHNPDIDDIARHCYMSKFHFFRTFRQAYGITPYQYLLGIKLEHAKKIIEKKDNPISEVAALCSFNSIHAFSRAFKKKFGKSPTRYWS